VKAKQSLKLSSKL